MLVVYNSVRLRLTVHLTHLNLNLFPSLTKPFTCPSAISRTILFGLQ